MVASAKANRKRHCENKPPSTTFVNSRTRRNRTTPINSIVTPDALVSKLICNYFGSSKATTVGSNPSYTSICGTQRAPRLTTNITGIPSSPKSESLIHSLSSSSAAKIPSSSLSPSDVESSPEIETNDNTCHSGSCLCRWTQSSQTWMHTSDLPYTVAVLFFSLFRVKPATW